MTHSHVVHAYPIRGGEDPVVELDLDWGTDDSYLLDLERYPGVTVSEIGRHEQTDWPIIRVVGPLEQLAHWVLIEYCGGDIEPANELIAKAKTPGEAPQPHPLHEEKTT